MHTFKKIISAASAALILASSLSVAAAAADTEKDYTIVDPYASVDWDTWNYYKANLHTHSTYSDGKFTLPEMVEKYYDRGYDILAMTDHGVINTGWTDDREYYPPFNLLQSVAHMSGSDYERITTGSDRDGRGMTDVTGGIEINNAVVSKTHVNGYYTDYGRGEWGIENDYAGAVEAIEKSGVGYSVLNHVGDWLNSNAYPERSHDAATIAYFANIFNENHSCLGMEIINNHDSVTRADRALWDELLQVVIPTGRNIIAFADDDSEVESDIGNSYEMFVMPENNQDTVKTALTEGTFFACSRWDKTNEPDILQGPDGGNVPLVTDIEVNQEDNTISLALDETRDCNIVEWIADGKVIATGTSIDLNDYEDEIGCYVRFQLKGDDGVTYSQAFEVQYEGRADKAIPEEALEKYRTPLGKIYVKIVHTKFFAILMLLAEKIGNIFG